MAEPVTIRPRAGANPLARLLAGAAIEGEAAEAIRAGRPISVEVDPVRRSWTVRVWFPRPVPAGALEALERAVEAATPGLAYAKVEAVYPDGAHAARALVAERWADVVERAGKILPVARGWLRVSRAAYDGGKVRVEVVGETAAEALKRARGEIAIAEAIFDLARESVEVEIAAGTFDEARTVLAEAAAAARRAGPAAAPAGAPVAPGRVLLGRPFPGEPTRIREIRGERRGVVVEGEVFDLEAGVDRNNRSRLAFSITDHDDSIRAKVFDPPAGFAPAEGARLRLRADAVKDRFEDDIVLRVRDAVVAPPPRGADPADEKRVELHAHTVYSRMDGTSDPVRLVERVADWGHAAIAITDHAVVQALPEAYAAGKRRGVKVITGCEVFCVDDLSPIVWGGAVQEDRPVDGEVVVLDVETTGLSPRTAEIIEIAAVRLRGGKVLDEFRTFVHPGRPLPPEVTRLTGISADDLRGAPSMGEVAPRLRAFLGDAPIVAHNAQFDAGFLRAALGALANPLVDTLRLAKALRPDLGDYRLGRLARAYGVPLAGGHRAGDDARALGAIWTAMATDLSVRGIGDLGALNRLVGAIPKGVLRTFRATLLVASEEGRRNLYRLVSASHVEFFHRKPRVPWSLLEGRRAGLLVGTGPHGSAFEAFLSGATDAELEEIFRRHDYAEVAPPEAYARFVAAGTIAGPDDLRAALSSWIDRAEAAGLPVVAVSDAHAIDPHEVRYRRILKAGEERPWADAVEASYLRTTPEMLEAFAFLGAERAHRIVVENTRALAGRCADVDPIPRGFHPPKVEGAEEEIRRRALARAADLYGDDPPVLVRERIDRELSAIAGHGYAGLYAIAARLVERSVRDGYPVGSRGSVGSSLVAHLCGITEVNPLPPHTRCPRCRSVEFREDAAVGADLPPADCPSCGVRLERDGWDIPFESFMGLSGEKVPDIDLNFSGDYQARAMRFLEETFGRDRVFRAGTILSIQERNALGYVLKYLEARGLSPRRAEVRRLVRGVTGVARTAGQHPGGVVLVPADREIHDFTPIQYPGGKPSDGAAPTTHFDYHSYEGVLVKVDVLGHDVPTQMRILRDLTDVDPLGVPLDEADVLSLFRSPEALGVSAERIGWPTGTLGIPEFGTPLLREILAETRPRTVADLVRISGLSHGTAVWTGNAQDLVRAGRATLSQVIATREDIFNDLVARRVEPAVAFRIMERVRKGRGLSDEDAAAMRAARAPDWMIDSCRKIAYLFPKAHAAAYVVGALRIAFFKVRWPAAFYAAYLTVNVAHLDLATVLEGEAAAAAAIRAVRAKGREATAREVRRTEVLEVAREALARGVTFLPPHHERSHPTRFRLEEGALRPPLIAVEGLGEKAAVAVASERARAPFRSVEEMAGRCRLARPVVENLRRLGALAGLPESDQATLFA